MVILARNTSVPSCDKLLQQSSDCGVTSLIRLTLRKRHFGSSAEGTYQHKLYLPTDEGLRHLRKSVDILGAALEVAERTVQQDLHSSRPVRPHRVRFITAYNKFIAPSPLPLTQEEIEKSWWSRDELDGMVESCLSSVATERLEQHSNWSQIISVCNDSSSDLLPDDEDTEQLVFSETRGLEADLAPVLKSYRKKHSQAVLQFQAPKTMPVDVQLRMLSARSMQLSRPHKILAQILARADEITVRRQS